MWENCDDAEIWNDLENKGYESDMIEFVKPLREKVYST